MIFDFFEFDELYQLYETAELYTGESLIAEKLVQNRKKFQEKYNLEILGYNAFMSFMSTLLPQKIAKELKERGHSVTLRKDARLSKVDFKRMLNAYKAYKNDRVEPYMMANVMSKFLSADGGYYFDANDESKAVDYVNSFTNACQSLYQDTINYAMIDYIRPGDPKYVVKNDDKKDTEFHPY